MRQHDGRFECALCGSVIDVPLDHEPRVIIKASSGEPNMRTITYDGREIHSCPIKPPRDAQT